FNACDGRTRTLFQSSDKGFDVDTDGTVTLKRQVTLHEGHKVFSVDAWDSSGKKHTVSVRVERVHHHHKDHHKDTVMNISSPQVQTSSFQKLLSVQYKPLLFAFVYIAALFVAIVIHYSHLFLLSPLLSYVYKGMFKRQRYV
ncbi:hypothetical protein PO909_023184, partial [Leuciscus waleckii]